MEKQLKKIYAWYKKRQRIIVILLIATLLTILLSDYVKRIIVTIIFIGLAGISKIYHRFIKTYVGIDLVLYLTLIIALVYKNTFLAMCVGWIGLILADSIGTRFSHTSFVSLIAVTIVVVVSKLFVLPLILNMIILTIVYELIAAALYYVMQSSIDKIIIFLVSHMLFNLFLIFSFTDFINKII